MNHTVTDHARRHAEASTERVIAMTRADAPDPRAAGRAADRAARREEGEDRVSFVRMLFQAVSWILLIAVSLLAIVVIVVPLVSGAKPYTVLTGSMEPLYPPGTLVVVKPAEPAEINLGDVITYQLESGKPDVVTHRVVGVGAAADGTPLFTTRGDANDGDDPDPVRPVQIVGELWYSVPYIGWVNNVVTGQARAWALPIAVAGLFIYGLVTIGLGFRDRRREKVAAREAAATEADAEESGDRPAEDE